MFLGMCLASSLASSYLEFMALRKEGDLWVVIVAEWV